MQMEGNKNCAKICQEEWNTRIHGFHPGPFSQVSRKVDLYSQVSMFPSFSSFSVVAQLEQPLETETQDY
jgi:hypothetical protein